MFNNPNNLSQKRKKRLRINQWNTIISYLGKFKNILNNDNNFV